MQQTISIDRINAARPITSFNEAYVRFKALLDAYHLNADTLTDRSVQLAAVALARDAIEPNIINRADLAKFRDHMLTLELDAGITPQAVVKARATLRRKIRAYRKYHGGKMYSGDHNTLAEKETFRQIRLRIESEMHDEIAHLVHRLNMLRQQIADGFAAPVSMRN